VALYLPKAMLIDLDDTILDDSSNVDSAWAEACKLADLPQEPLLEAIYTARDWYWSDPVRHKEGRVALRAASARIVEMALGPGNADLARRIANHYRDLRDEGIALLPGAVETLAELQKMGIAMALVTNGAALPQRAKVEKFGLADHFAHIQIEGEFGLGKPEPAVYHAAMNAIGTTPEDAWFVGDNLEWEVAVPQSLGLKGIWVDRSGKGVPAGRAVKPDAIIRGLPDLLTL